MKTISFFFFQLSLFLIASSANCEPNLSESDAVERLRSIHSQLSLLEGSFNDEYPEQLMSVMFIAPNDRVLEIGGNIGRNSCVISSLLKDSRNLVVAESDFGTATYLMANRERNGLFFHVENSAISKIPLMQSGWDTIPQKIARPGFVQVKTITYSQLKKKYGIRFNVLVADCEGALYYIFKDDERMLDDVNLIITENDYHHRDQYEDVRSKFISHGFKLVYNKAGGWGPCYNEFFQVWKKN